MANKKNNSQELEDNSVIYEKVSGEEEVLTKNDIAEISKLFEDDNESKNKKSKGKKNYWLVLFLTTFLGLLFIEGAFHIISFHEIFKPEIIRIILNSLVLSLIVSGINSLLKPLLARIFTCIFIFLVGFYSILQLTFHNLIGTFLSLNAGSNGGLGRVTEQIPSYINSIKPVYLLCLLPFIIILLILIITRKKYKKTEIKIYYIPIYILITLVFYLISIWTLYSSLFQDKNQIKTNIELYKQPTFLELSIKQFGVIKFLERDIIYMLNPVDTYQLSVGEVSTTEKTVEEKTNYTRTIDDTDWIEKMNNRTDSTIANLDNWFMNQNITSKNDYTGYFEDKNVIMLMIEAFDIIAIDQDLTPTLYKMMNEGIYFDNYYAPIYSCATGESEYISETSIIPSLTVCTPNSYLYNNYDNSIFNLFNNSGYYTSSYHSYNDTYYSRSILHVSMGSNLYLDEDELKITPILGWPSDLELIENSYPYYASKDKFFTFIITASTHFPYDSDTYLTKKYWDKVSSLPYSDKVKRYIAKAIDLDAALTYLMEQLENDGKLDDTVFILFGDHHPLNMSYSDINSASIYDRLEDFNINRMPFIIYNSQTESMIVDDTASTFDILPTIANLFNLNYDPRDYIGKDIFSDDENIVVFANGSWITDQGLYDSSTNTYKSYDEEMSEEYINNINTRVKDYFYVSDKILNLDYFSYKYGDKN